MSKKLQDFISPVELILPIDINSELSSSDDDRVVITCYPGYRCKTGEQEL
jgi:hypothetical protein